MARPSTLRARPVCCRRDAASKRWLAISLSALLGACAGPGSDPAGRTLSEARFVLLGEVHDNPLQHQARAALLRRLLADGRPTRVVFEAIDRGRDGAIAAAAAAAAPDDDARAEAVAGAGQLDRAAWRWPLHKPVIAAALAGGARVVGGNLPRIEARAIVRGGVEAAPPDLRQRLAATPWSAAQRAALEALIDRGHCGMLPSAMWPAMALAQRARDAALADAMLGAAASERAVLIAGNGHVRSDLGVPSVLRGAGVPAHEIVAVVYLEEGDEAVPADRVLRTPATARSDPCAPLRAPAASG